MSSLNNYNTFTRTMNGLNNINANKINTDNLDVDYLTLNVLGTVPNITPGSTSDTRIANTAFVQSALNTSLSGYAKLANNNTFTGYNIFNGGVEIGNFNLIIDNTCDIELLGNLYVQNGLIYYSITPIQISYLSGVTSNIQTQLNNRALLNAFNHFIYAKGQSNNPNIQITDSTGSKSIVFNTNSNSNYLNSLTASGESVIACLGSAIDTQSLCLTTWSSTGCAIKINPSSIRVRCSSNWIDYNTTNLTLNGPVSCTSTINSGSITSTGTITSNGYINYKSGSKNIYIGTAMSLSDYGMYMLYSGTGISTDFGIIQCEHQGTAYRPLILQPYGANVGIGITNPSFKLDVNGTGNFTNNVSCSTAPTTGNHLCNKTYVDSVISGSSILGTNNIFTGTNQFNNNVIIKDTSGTSEYFEIKQSVSISPSNTISRTQVNGGTYQTIHTFVNSSGYTGRCLITVPIAIYNSGTPAGGASTTFSVTLSSIPYQILKNGSLFVSPSTPFVVGGALPDTKNLLYTGSTGSYACEVYICEISISFNILSSSTDTYAIQLNYSGSTSLPSSTNQYVCGGSVSTFQAISGPISMTSSSNTGYLSSQFNSSPLYNPSGTLGNNGYCALPRVINIMPCGTIINSLSKIPPYGFLLCDGSTINISDYPDLFGLIQYDYGYGVYGISFKLPNLSGAFLRGAGAQTYSGVNYDGGDAGYFQQDQTLTIKQQGFYNFSTGSGRQCPARFQVGTDPLDTGISVRADRMGSEVRPFSFSTYYYIKT